MEFYTNFPAAASFYFIPLVTLETVLELIIFRKYFFIAYIARSSHYFGKLNELGVFESKTSRSIKEETSEENI